jgi:LacI family transcriptional regulator
MSIIEIAEKAGVSSSTVSRVINNRPRVSRRAKLAVKAAMQAMNYTPSDNRPGPKLGPRTGSRTPTIAMLVFGPSDMLTAPAFGDLMKGVSIGASELGVNFVFHHVRDSDDLPAQITSGQINGVLLHSRPPLVSRKLLEAYPTVWLMGNRYRPEWGDQVMPDPYEIGARAGQYLISRGHRHLAYLNLDRGHWPFRVASQGFKDAAFAAHLDCDILERENGQSEYVDWLRSDIRIGEELVERLIQLPSRPTGLFVADDVQVAVLQPAIQRAGVEIATGVAPGAVEIISCNNERPYLIGLSPKPAEIDIHVQAVGHRGVERLLWRINNPDVVERIVTSILPSVRDHDGNSYAAVAGHHTT